MYTYEVHISSIVSIKNFKKVVHNYKLENITVAIIETINPFVANFPLHYQTTKFVSLINNENHQTMRI